MNYKKEDLGNNKLKFIVAVDKDILNKNYLSAVKRLGKNAKVAGFRSGHIPVDILEKSIDPSLLANAEIDSSINESIMKIIETEDLLLLSQPEVNIVKYIPKDTLEFTAEIEVVPPVKLADSTKLKVKKPEIKVDESRIGEVLSNLQTSLAEKKDVKREAKTGDQVVIDFTGIRDGKEFAGGKATDYPLQLGSGSFIPGFEEGIIGHEAGDKFDIEVTFPKEYGARDLAGKKATFEINLKKVQELKLPELNDEFAAKVAPDLKTLKDLKLDIEGELRKQEESVVREKYETDILNALCEASNIEVPQKMIDNQFEDAKKNFERDLMYRGLDLASYLAQSGKTEEEWLEKDFIPSLRKSTAQSLAIRQISKDNNIDATEEEINERQSQMAGRYTNPEVKKQFESADFRNQLARQIINEKSIQKLIDLVESNK